MTNFLYEIMRLISSVLLSLFSAMDAAKIDDYSLLDIAIALVFLKVVIWFVKKFLGIESSNLGDAAGRTASRVRSWEGAVVRLSGVKKKRR